MSCDGVHGDVRVHDVRDRVRDHDGCDRGDDDVSNKDDYTSDTAIKITKTVRDMIRLQPAPALSSLAHYSLSVLLKPHNTPTLGQS
jgi:hypothetical protein